MLKTGKEYLESLKDGRRVFVGNELIKNVTAHPAFCGAASMYAAMYEMKRSDENKELMSFPQDGEQCSTWFMRPKSREDLVKRRDAHRKIAAFSHGLLGRSPDHISSSITGMSMRPHIFDETPDDTRQYSENISQFHRRISHNDDFICYAILPPQGARKPELYEGTDRKPPTLRVVDEDDNGVFISGMKMLATGAVYANEILIGNIIPLAPSQIKESITCTVPVNANGLSLWARKPFATDAQSEFDNPLSTHFDESDSMVICDRVKVPWEDVFVFDNVTLSRDIYVKTPAHFMANHQSNIRFHAKLRLLVGLASKVAKSNGADAIPAVRETLGRLASYEAAYGAMIDGQIQGMEEMDNGYVHVNRRAVYAAVNYALENHSKICDEIRTLMGGGVFQMPANVNIVEDETMRAVFEQYWSTLDQSALTRMKLFKLAWDLLGSEFAARHDQYEKFYVGAAFIVRNYNFTNAPWDELEALSDDIMDRYDAPK